MTTVLEKDSVGTDIVESVGNYYEVLVAREIDERQLGDTYDYGTLQDVACTALNQLAARYIRSEVDLLFFTSAIDLGDMAESVTQAVDYALSQVAKRQ